MRCIAHRGFAAVAPENTIGAVRAAADRADAVEFDVRRCGTGELVVVHDETIDRVTDGTGTVAALSLAALADRSVRGTGEGIPTLAAMLAAVPPTVEVHIELKERGLAADVLAILDRTDLPNRVVVTSFLPGELRTIRERDSSQPIGLLASHRLETPVTTAVELDCAVLGANRVRCLATGIVPRATAVDLEVHAWTVERAATARLLERRGVDYVSADRPLDV
ncbi:glycerophosphodiester phosphodiesterase [Natrinema thermotolerans]|uniref:Glycerophosphodiester phosphodiesterase n=1 Tax=Natrinema thermotolerans TaxID=121872 RepID=A0AAF0T2U4_9EURY|nr:glycerophosphodiester phosphodiesterase [Natrinema thermotolerans]QCC57608.1 glycerophosphodiester phosphodiesterase [Natrinema thermotolerans]WMT08687.1 glycerophosphodiester phosphodiesterase [Natrinema thermotolerans]